MRALSSVGSRMRVSLELFFSLSALKYRMRERMRCWLEMLLARSSPETPPSLRHRYQNTVMILYRYCSPVAMSSELAQPLDLALGRL